MFCSQTTKCLFKMQDIEKIAREKLSHYDSAHPKASKGKSVQYIENRVVEETCKEYHKSIYMAMNLVIAIGAIILISCLIGAGTKADNVYYFPLTWLSVAVCALFLIILLILYRFINSSLQKETRERISHLLKK